MSRREPDQLVFGYPRQIPRGPGVVDAFQLHLTNFGGPPSTLKRGSKLGRWMIRRERDVCFPSTNADLGGLGAVWLR